MRQFAQGCCVAQDFLSKDLIMEQRKKKMNFLIGWILRIPRLEKIRARNQEALIVDLQKQVNELGAELWNRRAHVDNSFDVEKKDDLVEEQEDEEEIICEPEVEEDER